MKKVMVYLEDVEKAKSMVNILSQYDYDCDLSVDKMVIDAKSFMGIMSLGIGKPLELTIHEGDGNEEILEKLKPYLYKEEN